MNRRIKTVLASLLLAAGTGAAHANDLEGTIESVDAGARSFVVQGIRFFVDQRTDYDDGQNAFEDQGQRVEVDFRYRDGRHLATEIELED